MCRGGFEGKGMDGGVLFGGLGGGRREAGGGRREAGVWWEGGCRVCCDIVETEGLEVIDG